MNLAFRKEQLTKNTRFHIKTKARNYGEISRRYQETKKQDTWLLNDHSGGGYLSSRIPPDTGNLSNEEIRKK